MNTATTIAQWVIRIAGLIQIVLGLLFWTRTAMQFIPLHMQIGYVLVLALCVLALLGLRAGVPGGLVALALVWVVVTPVLGIMQSRLLPGSFHWIIQVLHLLVGLAAMGLGDQLATRIKGRQTLMLQTEQ